MAGHEPMSDCIGEPVSLVNGTGDEAGQLDLFVDANKMVYLLPLAVRCSPG